MLSSTTTKTSTSIMTMYASLLLVLLMSGCRNIVYGQTAYYTNNNLGVRNYTASEGNPMKGLAATNWSPEPALVDFALEYSYVRYDTIVVDYQNGKNVYDWSGFEKSLNECVGRKRQLVPRVFIHYVPYNPNLPANLFKVVEMRSHNDYGGGLSPFYGDPELLNSMQEFIYEYARIYDGDSRIAYIQTGLLGYWAEWHTLGMPFIPDETREKILDWYGAAFSKTQIMTRYPSSWAKDNKMGYHDDSFTYSTIDGVENGGKYESWFYWPDIVSKNNADVWRYAPLGGETRPENVREVLKQSWPAPAHNKQDFFICATTTHTVYMKHGSFEDDYAVKEGRMIHTNMGYNFQIRTVAATAINNNAAVKLDVTIEQIGYTPFYYPLSLSVNCKGIATPRTASGVEKLIDQFQTSVYSVTGLPSTSDCLSSVSFTLTSPMIQPYRPMKWAQGINGIITLNIPLPSGNIPVIIPEAPVVAPAPIVVVVTPPAAAPVGIQTVPTATKKRKCFLFIFCFGPK